MGERIRIKVSPLIRTHVTKEMGERYKKAAEKFGYPFNTIKEGEMYTDDLEVIKGYEFITIGTSTMDEKKEVMEEVLKLEEEAFKDNS